LTPATIATGGASALNSYTDYCTNFTERVGQNGVVTVIDYVP
jgi:hypothetical protein